MILYNSILKIKFLFYLINKREFSIKCFNEIYLSEVLVTYSKISLLKMFNIETQQFITLSSYLKTRLYDRMKSIMDIYKLIQIHSLISKFHWEIITKEYHLMFVNKENKAS